MDSSIFLADIIRRNNGAHSPLHLAVRFVGDDTTAAFSKESHKNNPANN
jgi:hypothetical protein